MNEKQVLTTIEKALGLPEGKLNGLTQSSEIAEWDSLGHLSILAALDREFNGKVASIRELASAASVPQILNQLKQHGLLQ